MERVPLVLDGVAALAAAAVVFKLSPSAVEHCVLAAVPKGDGYAALADELGFRPLLRPLNAEGGVAAPWRSTSCARRPERLEVWYRRARDASAMAAGGDHREGGELFHDAGMREDGDGLGTLAQLRMQLELAAVDLDQSLDDRQTQAGALFRALDGDRALSECSQHDRNFVRGMPGP